MPAGIAIERYHSDRKALWDDFVRGSKNGTFLFMRDYLDHQHDRFTDSSLIVRVNDEPLALLPAHRDGKTVGSHLGLTYGGLVMSPRMSLLMTREIFDAVEQHFAEAGAATLIYKTVPHIYHRQPAEEDRDVLYRRGAMLIRRNMFAVVDMWKRPPLQERRLRGIKSARKASVAVGQSWEWGPYWDVLTERLATTYSTRPVHSLDEILKLHRTFPEHIRLFTASENGKVVAGAVVYESSRVARLQYIAASERGREVCALDLLFAHLLDNVYAEKRFVDFGSSNDAGDRDINLGLIEFKEGFGGRAVAHDWYRLELITSR